MLPAAPRSSKSWSHPGLARLDCGRDFCCLQLQRVRRAADTTDSAIERLIVADDRIRARGADYRRLFPNASMRF